MSKPQKTQIDFSKYRTPDLIETIAEIIGLPGAIASIVKCALIGVAALVLVVWLLLYLTGSMTLMWATIFEVYSAPAGAIVGTAIGVAEFIRRSLSNMTKLVDLMLETTIQVAKDAQGLSKGDTEMPPTRDLVEDVYEQVILVITKQVLSKMFGFLAMPIYWVYHMTLNRLVRITIRLIPGDSEISAELSEKVSQSANESGRVIASLRWTQEKLASVGGWIRLLVMIPCYATVLFAVGLIMLVPALVWWIILSE